MNYDLLPDELLVIYLRNGDQKAFREIYQRYWKKMYSIARRKIQDLEVVEEMVQDIFLRLWERRGVQQIEQLDAYLFTATRYAIINHIKAMLVQKKYADHAFTSFTEAEFTTDAQMNLDELIHVVEQRLNDLPEKTRQIFRLNRLEYQTVKEISSQLKVPERTVEYHISQALRTLRHYLQDYLIACLLLILLP